ncbi:peptidyl-prolyl cis-trans isomerase [candidate division KSB1 bacterium]|nr:peptidyl-prolyl cis-trans isomerase [candidate division KSB1 bacterium]
MPQLYKTYHMVAFSIVVLLMLCASCSDEKVESQQVIVKIRDEELTLEMLREMIPVDDPSMVSYEQIQNYIQRWIERELTYQEAVRLGMKKNDAELKKIVKRAEKNYLIDSLMDSLWTEEVEISEQEMMDYYEKNKDNFLSERIEIRALHILVEDMNVGREVRRRLLNGEDFESVAREVSLDYERNLRIDLGYFASENIIPEIGNTLFRQREGTLTQPLSSQFGYHIFKILDKRDPNTQKEFDEVKEEIHQRLLAIRHNEIYNDFIADIKNKVDVKTNFEYLKDFFTDSLTVKDDLMSN